MKVFFYARAATRGFDNHPADVIRVEIVLLHNPILGTTFYQWCHNGQWVLEDIPQGEAAIDNIQQAASWLGTTQKWTLLEVVPSGKLL